MKALFEKQTHISLVATQINMQTAFSILKDINEKGCSFIGNYIVYEPKLIIEGGAYYEKWDTSTLKESFIHFSPHMKKPRSI